MTVVSFPNVDVLCVCGFPSKELIGWLEEKPERQLVVFDEEEREIDHERIHVCLPEDEAMEAVSQRFVFLSFGYLPGNQSEKLFQRMAYFEKKTFLLASDFQDRGLSQLRNYLRNYDLSKEAKRGVDLFNTFKGIPAIICGAGPSLEQVAENLSSLKEKALFFAGGTALSSLAKYGIQPHFAGAIDPHPPQKRMRLHKAEGIPLFYQQRVHPDVLKRWKGEKLWVFGGEQDLFEEESFDGGWNVSTFLTALAYQMGCSPIILVGVDLSQSKGKAYAGNLPRTEGGELVSIEGSDLMSRLDWLFARDWLSNFALGHPDVEWIQGSPGGLDFKGFSRKSLGDISLASRKDLQSKVEAEVKRAKVKHVVKGFSEELLVSYKRVADGCTQILKIAEQTFPSPPQKEGKYILAEVEIEKEVAYQKHLLPVWKIWKPVFARQIPKEAPQGYGIELHQWLFIQEVCRGATAL